MILLAQAATDYLSLTPEKMAIAFVVAVMGFLCLYFKNHINKVHKRLDRIEAVAISNVAFKDAVVAASLSSDSVPSKLIHDFHEHHKPADLSGIHTPIKIRKEK